MKNYNGFTLIELMIVIAIMGILIALALPAYQTYVAKAQITEALSLLSGQKQLMVEMYASTGKCPSNQNSPQISTVVNKIEGKPLDYAGKYVAEVRIGTTPVHGLGARCSAYAVFKKEGVSSLIAGQWIALVYETAKVADNPDPGGSTSTLGTPGASTFAFYSSTKIFEEKALIKDCEVSSTKLIDE